MVFSIAQLSSFLAVAGLLMAGCSGDSAVGGAIKSAATLSPAKVWIEEVRFKPSADVNNNAPVTVDLVVAYDDGLLGQLSGLSAQDYYNQRDQLRRDNPDKGDFFTWDISPGLKPDDASVDLTKISGVGGVFYARYASPGAHRLALAGERVVQLTLSKDDFSMAKIR